MTHSAHPSYTEHPVALGSFRSWLHLLRGCPRADRAFIPRLCFVLLTTLLTSPLRLWERIRYGRTIGRTAIHPSPVFIVGHWRSGTTHLQNLLCQDRNFATLSTFQAMAPGFCIVGDKHIKPVLAKLAHKRYPTRLIDNIPLGFDAPQEDEFAIASLSPLSFLHTFSFPRQASDLFEKAVLFHGLPESMRRQWCDMYLRLLRKITWICGGRRLVIKNCAHSGRIRTLLELFPDAKFIHIHRNPYEVFASTVHMHKMVLPRSQLQTVEPDRIETNVLGFYIRLMERFLVDKPLIPDKNLVEIRYEDLEREPLEQIRTIYETLGLSGFEEEAKPRLSCYIDSIANYKKNEYTLNDNIVAKVNEHWHMTFKEWGYDRIASSPQVEVNTGG